MIANEGEAQVTGTADAAATLAAELVACRDEDLRVRAELIAASELFAARYHPRMQQVHERNADRLAAIVDRIGWPTAGLVGEPAAEAAWLIAQHAISRPEMFRRFAAALEAACEHEQAPAWQAAMMVDRIRVLEGRPQLFGTQFDWDEHGRLSPAPIEGSQWVDERRRGAGLGPLAERQAELRERAAREGEAPPQDWNARRAAFERWAAEVGWR
jgi:hypothetical protein